MSVPLTYQLGAWFGKAAGQPEQHKYTVIVQGWGSP